MKILLVNNLGIDYGGTEVIVRQLKDGLRAKGHEVRVFAGDRPTSNHIFSDYTFRSFSDSSKMRFFLFICNPFAVWALYKTIKDFKPDIVHFHNISKGSPFIFSLLQNIPAILSIHDFMSFDPTRLQDMPTLETYKDILSGYFILTKKNLRYYAEKIRFFFFRKLNKNVDLATGCSNFCAKAAGESKLFNHITVLYDGVQPLKFFPITNNRTLLFFGRIEQSKGLQVLLRAMPEILRQKPDTKLIIAGDGNFRNSCETLSKELNVSDSVTFLGYVEHENISKLLVESTIVVVPSLWPEPFGLVSVEAMLVGRPVIASNVGGIPEVVQDEKTGLLFDRSKPGELSVKVLRLLKDPQECIKFGEAGSRYANEKFTMQIFIDRTIKLYEEVITASRKAD